MLRSRFPTRQPFLVISPFAKPNFVDHTLTDQSSILRFIEDNWETTTRIGDQSFDAIAGSILNMFDFQHGQGDDHGKDDGRNEDVDRRLILNDDTGEVK